MSEQAGRANQYLCEECGQRTTTINAVDGTTPFMIRCRGTIGCKGTALSQLYRVSQDLLPRYEWYKPDGAEIETLDRATLEHVARGGLLLRRLDGEGREKYGYRLRRG